MPNDYSTDPPVATAGQLLAISDKIVGTTLVV